MLTPRGWWLLLVALFVAAMGVALSIQRGATIAVLGLTILAWMVFEWCAFLFSVRWTLPQIEIERELHDDRGPVVTLWAQRSFTVVVRLTCDSRLPTPLIMADDRFPFGVELVGGTTHGAGVLRRGQTLEVRYRLRCKSAGPVRFEGVRLRFADPQGFFYHETFLRQPLVYPALPPLVDADLKQRATKRHNVLMPPGIHRLHRAGSGSELLDLRDYRPGDPPKMIAWKPSARKDKLITKEFENEVPVRCTLVLDAGQSVRLGPAGHNALARLVEIGSGVAQAALANRDHVGLIVFDERESTYVVPARGRRHLIEMLRRLSEAGRLPPSSAHPDLSLLIPLAHALCQEIYPDLLAPYVNHHPWWLPILFPRPEYLRTLTLPDAILPWLRRFMPSEWRRQAVRKKLSAVMGVTMGYSPGAMALMAEDDEPFAHVLQELLVRHQVPYPIALYDWRGQYQFAQPDKIAIAAAALLRAVRRGRDNELFVLMVDVLEQLESLEPLRRAIRVALGRHHRVVLVAPWQPDIPVPGSADEEPPPRFPVDMLGNMRRAMVERYQRAFEEVRREFGRLGVPVVRAQQHEAMQLILDRMEQLRVAGIRRHAR